MSQSISQVVVFGILGFAFGKWLLVIAAMIAAGLLGTFTGRMVLGRMSEGLFQLGFKILLGLISARLIWSGINNSL